MLTRRFVVHARFRNQFHMLHNTDWFCCPVGIHQIHIAGVFWSLAMASIKLLLNLFLHPLRQRRQRHYTAAAANILNRIMKSERETIVVKGIDRQPQTAWESALLRLCEHSQRSRAFLESAGSPDQTRSERFCVPKQTSLRRSCHSRKTHKQTAVRWSSFAKLLQKRVHERVNIVPISLEERNTLSWT